MGLVNKSMAADGVKNATFKIAGILPKDPGFIELFRFEAMAPRPKSIRIESILFAIREKIGFDLWWTGEENIYLMPLEGKSMFKFEDQGYIQSPPGASGLIIKTFNWKADTNVGFLLIIDMVKQ